MKSSEAEVGLTNHRCAERWTDNKKIVLYSVIFGSADNGAACLHTYEDEEV